MLIVQYPMYFSGPPGNINKQCSTPLALCAVESTNTTKVHAFLALLLSSKYYKTNAYRTMFTSW